MSMRSTEFESVLSHARSDTLLVALLLAVAFHALIILGVSFQVLVFDPDDRVPPTLDIILVNKPNARAPEEADYLAAESQDGSGNVQEKVPFQEARQAASPNAPPPTPAPPEPEVLTREESREAVQVTEVTPAPPQQTPSVAELYESSKELITLDEQIKQSMQAYSERPRQTFISAATREFKYANYMNDWVSKVERVGNLNYPDEARRQGMSGSLILDVALRPDGSIFNITIRRPSGHKVLDEAAMRIVRLAAPFPPFPEDIRKGTDILHITRTWEFQSSGLQSR